MTEQTNQVYLVLENGAAFAGSPIGDWSSQTNGSPSAPEKSGTGPENAIRSVGELVFTTGMTGYLETLTDPSYAGQIILQTFPMIGNYGVISSDFEGKCFARGYVVRELCNMPSNFRSEGRLDAWLKAAGIPGICGVDTRELTRIIRENGVMNACLCTGVPDDLSEVRSYRVHDVLREVSTGENVVFDSENGESPESAAGKRPAVVLVDYGAKRNIVRCLVKRGCRVTVRQKMNMRFPRSQSWSARCPCSGSAWGTSSARWRWAGARISSSTGTAGQTSRSPTESAPGSRPRTTDMPWRTPAWRALPS